MLCLSGRQHCALCSMLCGIGVLTCQAAGPTPSAVALQSALQLQVLV
jgi:hypothetical protein